MTSIFDAPEFTARLFFPRPGVSPVPDGAEDRFIAVSGARLHLRWHRRDRALPTLLLFHGNGETVSDYDDMADNYHEAGVNLAVVDYRGYGGSTGTPSLRSIIEDAGEVARMMAAECDRLVIMGRSLGSVCAAALYRQPPASVRGFVWESGFVDLAALIVRRGMNPPAAFSEAEQQLFDSAGKLRRGRHPLLVLHGAQDDLIAPSEAQGAFAAAGTSQKQLQLIPGRGHNDLSWAPQYWAALARFIGSLPGIMKG